MIYYKDAINKVKCELCGRYFHSIVYHLNKSHMVTPEQYSEIFPNAKLVSDDFKSRASKNISRINEERIANGIHQFQTNPNIQKIGVEAANKYRDDHPEEWIKRGQHMSRVVWSNKEHRDRMLPILMENSKKYTRESGRNYKTGYYYSKKCKKSYFYRSSYELMMYNVLDMDDDVLYYDVESLKIEYVFDGRRHYFVPDIMAFYKNGDRCLIEVKPEYLVINDEITKIKLKSMRNYCKEKGLGFLVITEKELFNGGIEKSHQIPEYNSSPADAEGGVSPHGSHRNRG